MMKNTFLIILTLISVSVFSQNTADKLILESINSVNSLKSYSVDATVTTGKETFPIKIYSSGDKYRFVAHFLERIYDGKYNYNIMHDEKEINIELPDSSDITLGSVSSILRNLHSAYTPSIGAKTTDTQSLILKAKDPKLKSEVVLIIDLKTKMPKSITEKTPSGTVLIKILKIDPQGLKDNSIFVLDKQYYKSKGYYIVEP